MIRSAAVITALTALAMGVAAQENAVMNKIFPQSFGVLDRVVKGAPYSAEEISESVRLLGDGTRIRQNTHMTFYRDSEGRVRREGATEVTIWDPVADVKISLVPKTMTAIEIPMGKLPAKVTTTNATAADLQKLKAELDAQKMMVNGNPADAQTTAAMKEKLDQAMASLSNTGRPQTVVETLGRRLIEGVSADGTRSTTTIEPGAIGNDRPIRLTDEHWYSPDLHADVLHTTNDPRSGEVTWRLVNVHRVEPAADLFAVPAGYQVVNIAGAAKN